MRGRYTVFNPFNPDIPLAEEAGRYWCRPGFEDHPVVGVSWHGAELVSRLLGGRLPSVVEWEAAGGPHVYPWGNRPPKPKDANYDFHVGSTVPVKSYAAGVTGLFDLAGNVGEWCAGESSASSSRVSEMPVKGGAWNKPAEQLRLRSTRYKWGSIGTVGIGFRVVFDV